eukprot:UN27056
MVSGGDDGKVKIWNSDTGFCFVTFNEHSGPISNVVFSIYGNRGYIRQFRWYCTSI